MKKINRNTEKRQRVRVLETGELGTVTDQQLIPRQGRLHVYRQVRLDKKPHLDRWFWDDQLGGTRERCRVTFEDDRGSRYHLDITKNHEENDYTIGIQGRRENPEPSIRMLLFQLMLDMLRAIGVTTEELENATYEG